MGKDHESTNPCSIVDRPDRLPNTNTSTSATTSATSITTKTRNSISANNMTDKTYVEYSRHACDTLGINPSQQQPSPVSLRRGSPPVQADPAPADKDSSYVPTFSGDAVDWPLHRWPDRYMNYLDKLFLYIAAKIQDERIGYSEEEEVNTDLLCRVEVAGEVEFFLKECFLDWKFFFKWVSCGLL